MRTALLLLPLSLLLLSLSHGAHAQVPSNTTYACCTYDTMCMQQTAEACDALNGTSIVSECDERTCDEVQFGECCVPCAGTYVTSAES